MKALVIAEHKNTELLQTTASVVAAGLELTSEVDILLVGYQMAAAVAKASKLSGVGKVVVVDDVAYQSLLPENIASVVAKIAKAYDYVLAAATTTGKNLLPRVAALLDTEMLSDVITIIDQETFVRPIYAGNALATVKYTAAKKLLTVRTTRFEPVQETEQEASVLINKEHIIENVWSELLARQEAKAERPDLTKAKIAVVAGRGIKNEENRLLIEQLAAKLNAAVGATRAAVDMGLFPNDYQVGQTGKTIAPEVYIGIALSGSPQHIAGIRDSKKIIAINNDPNAPIFQIADYGIVADFAEVVPKLIKGLYHNAP